jgi:secreted Zn-dependent insulinase-like peptidase
MLATTKQVRALVRGLCNVRTHSYTDKSYRDDRRNVTFMLCENKQQAKDKLQLAMFLMGYTNTIKTTTSKVSYAARSGGYSYLRIHCAY